MKKDVSSLIVSNLSQVIDNPKVLLFIYVYLNRPTPLL